MKNCKYCNNEFENRIKNVEICNNKECKAKLSKEKYNSTTYVKICKMCNSEFNGFKKATICSQKCKDTLKEKKYLILQKVICKHCDKHITTKNKYANIFVKHLVALEIKRTCSECRHKQYEKWANEQKGENNTNWTDNKKSRRKYTDEELKIIQTVNNPMKNKTTALKVANSIKLKYVNNELIRPIGKLSTLYKGNRKRGFTIRDRLKFWKIDNLIRTNYTCEICNKHGGKLEIHHKNISFREILDKELNNRILDDLSYDDFEILIKNICELHKCNIIGQVLCKECHSSVDEYRKLKLI